MKESFKKLLKPANTIVLGTGIILCGIFYNVYKNTYEQKIYDLRKEKDHYFRTSIHSPVANKEKFEGLSYFDAKPEYQVVAKVSKFSQEEFKEMMSSDGRKLMYRKFATASFTINQKYCSLLLLQRVDAMPDQMLFVPFTDKTNGEETYQGGRYLDVSYDGKDKINLDFNQSYHPYCVYSYKYSCPLAPQENYIPLRILAGERLAYHQALTSK